MITQIAYIFYFIILVMVILSALFIIFHIIRYSFNKVATMLMLGIFIPVTLILILINIILFSLINFENMFSFF